MYLTPMAVTMAVYNCKFGVVKSVVSRAILLFIFMPFAGNASAYWMEVKGSEKLNEAVLVSAEEIVAE